VQQINAARMMKLNVFLIIFYLYAFFEK